jgi:hypothetical protein
VSAEVCGGRRPRAPGSEADPAVAGPPLRPPAPPALRAGMTATTRRGGSSPIGPRRRQPVASSQYLGRHGGRIGRRGEPALPPVEPAAGAGRIGLIAAHATRAVLPGVAQHVRERVPHLAWRGQQTGVVALGDHAAAPVPHAVGRASDPDGQRAHAATQAISAFGLDNEVDVVALNRVLHEPEVGALTAAAEAPLDPVHHGPRAQRRQARGAPHRHVADAPVKRGPADMGHRAAGAPASRARREPPLLLHPSRLCCCMVATDARGVSDSHHSCKFRRFQH